MNFQNQKSEKVDADGHTEHNSALAVDGFWRFQKQEKSVWSNDFWCVKYGYSESVFNPIKIEIKHKC